MLFLAFELGVNRFALDAACVVEVLPLLEITRLPQAPPGVAGVSSYHGSPVPVIDVSALLLGRPAARRLSTRLVIVRYQDDRAGVHDLGLMLERATGLARLDTASFVDSGLTNGRSPYLGRVATDDRGFIQRVDVHALLPASVRELLFQAPVSS